MKVLDHGFGHLLRVAMKQGEEAEPRGQDEQALRPLEDGDGSNRGRLRVRAADLGPGFGVVGRGLLPGQAFILGVEPVKTTLAVAWE